jgi:Raf kinase inhibitor-like YbhB/YbcL family protein
MTGSTIAINKKLIISSPAFAHEDYIPMAYSCEGSGKNPPVVINGLPEHTKSLVLIVEDPDAPGKIFDHWIVWNIPPAEIIPEDSIPGIVGKNSRGENRYTGPCPPSGTHRYYFKVYALDTLLFIDEKADKNTIIDAMQAHILDYGELIGLYKKLK